MLLLTFSWSLPRTHKRSSNARTMSSTHSPHLPRRARDLLLGFIDPDLRGITLPRCPQREDVLVARLTDLARRDPAIAKRLITLCATFRTSIATFCRR